MMSGKSLDQSKQATGESLGYLHGRIREEAEAAVAAATLEATLAHVHLATAYAQRIRRHPGSVAGIHECWVDHRLW